MEGQHNLSSARKWIAAILLMGITIGGILVSALDATSIRIIPNYGTIKAISANNKSVTIPSNGSIVYASKELCSLEQRYGAYIMRLGEGLNISEPKGSTRIEPKWIGNERFNIST